MNELLDSDVLELEEVSTGQGFGSSVVLFNDSIHSFDEVINQIIKATSKTFDEAKKITYEIDSVGEAICFNGSVSKCMSVITILEDIQLRANLVIGDVDE